MTHAIVERVVTYAGAVLLALLIAAGVRYQLGQVHAALLARFEAVAMTAERGK